MLKCFTVILILSKGMGIKSAILNSIPLNACMMEVIVASRSSISLQTQEWKGVMQIIMMCISPVSILAPAQAAVVPV